jgi:hypothetical protein
MNLEEAKTAVTDEADLKVAGKRGREIVYFAKGFLEGYEQGVRDAEKIVVQYEDENAQYYEVQSHVTRRILKLLDEVKK